MNDIVSMKSPASFLGQMWRDAIPLGNGLTGALVYGGVATEHILLNRCDLWHMETKCVLPDVSDVFKQMREKMDEGHYQDAQNMLCDALRQEGYDCNPGVPFPLGMLEIELSVEGIFKGYERNLHMDSGECEIAYSENGNKILRKCFISRKDDVFVYHIKADSCKEVRISFGMHDDGTEHTRRKKEELEGKYHINYQDGYILFNAYNKEKQYGTVVKVESARADGDALVVKGKEITVLVKCFSECDSLTNEGMMTAIDQCENNYESILTAHLPIHKALYNSAELTLTENQNVSNEILLDEAYQEYASVALIEKLWKFGRYLFISGTCEGGLPFPLYGMWHGEYSPVWAQHVANENVQIIYWHLSVGNLSLLVKPLIKYYCSRMEEYREAARKLFGCRGIFLSVYSTPVNGKPGPVVPVILHYIGVAGWLSQHFYDYYKMTGDRELLEECILPFMKEAALFYRDYACYDENGKLEIYPSVSPENSPKNFIKSQAEEKMSHSMPVARNATMDIGIIKELLKNLIVLSEEFEVDPDEMLGWQEMLGKMPKYDLNVDGAVKEWQYPGFEDNYYHRHLSHLYPFFPGKEITRESNLYPAFEKAVDLRILQGQSGWSLSHMAGIYAAMGKGEEAANCIDILCKGCLQRNFMTTHNDYRSMGVSLDLGQFAPIQLDANMGIVNAVQMMLLQADDKTLKFLPALPKRMQKGAVKNFAFSGGVVNFAWDKGYFEAVISVQKDASVKFVLPESDLKYYVCFEGNELEIDSTRYYDLAAGDSVHIRTA